MISNKPTKRVDVSTLEYPKDIPNLLEAQTVSYNEFLNEGIFELFKEVNPIEDYSGELWSLEFVGHQLGEPKNTFEDAKRLNLSFDAPLYIKTRLINKQTGEIKEQDLFVADVPLMNDKGTFVINGIERSVVMQIVRSEGILFVENSKSKSDKLLYSVKLMPERGYWYEFEINKYDVMSVKLVDKRPKILLTTLLRAFGYSSDDEIRSLFKGLEKDDERNLLESTLLKDKTKSREEALVEIYHKLKPEDTITIEAAEVYVNGFFFNDRKFYLGKTGRYKVNKKLGFDADKNKDISVLTNEDFIEIIRALIKLNHGELQPDDVDHLANRRVRGVGELISSNFRMGIRRMEKNIRDKMSTYGGDELLTPLTLVSTKPVAASINEFFGSSSVSRYMDKENMLSELESKRRITAGGQGGLSKERATFSVRDVHFSHYGRLCPIETPEGPHIGIVSHMAIYSRINEYGFLETPYRKVKKTVNAKDKDSNILNRILAEDVKGIGKSGDSINKTMLTKIKKSKDDIKVKPYITDEIEFFDADEEMKYKIGMITVDQDEYMNILDDLIPVRTGGDFGASNVDELDFVDFHPSQIAGVSVSLVPYVQNNDSNRALMASNMQRQAVPLVIPGSPIVGTGMEETVAKASGYGIYADYDGTISAVDSSFVELTYKEGGKNKKVAYTLDKYSRSNQNTCFDQHVVVNLGQKVKKGELLADGASMDKGELALGQNILIAYMFYEGFNYEDGIVISEKLVKDDSLTSIHIKEYTQDIRDTKLGPELITRDIPNVSEYALRNLDEGGIVRIGAKVGPQDILVGIIAPKGESELSAEEKLLRAIFGEYARDVRDNSMQLPHGDGGVVVNVQVLDKAKGDKLNPGVLKQVKVWVAKTHKISIGDKLAGRYGDKGVIAKVLPEEDMPHTADGTPVDMIISPIFVKRQNIGQLKEIHMAALAKALGINIAVPVFSPYNEELIEEMAKKEGIEFTSKVDLYDGRTGEKFDKKVSVGPRYYIKLNHLADDKVHARSTGPYTMVTQQPLGGKAQFGGQRFGEMEVWALEAHGVPYVLQEMLTIKSDDVVGRANAYKSIIQGQPIQPPTIPESFKVLISELRSMGLAVEQILKETDEEDDLFEEEEVSESVQEVIDEL